MRVTSKGQVTGVGRAQKRPRTNLARRTGLLRAGESDPVSGHDLAVFYETNEIERDVARISGSCGLSCYLKRCVPLLFIGAAGIAKQYVHTPPNDRRYRCY